MIDQLGLTADAVTLSPLKLFVDADIVVKIIMIGLALASIWTWSIIVGSARAISRSGKQSRLYERDFWKTEDIDAFYKTRGKEDVPSAHVLSAGVQEWRRSTNCQNTG